MIICDKCVHKRYCIDYGTKTDQCEYCDLMTNEEWFCGLNTERKAHFFAERFGGSADRYNNIYDTMWAWLKQPHHEKE